MKNHPKCMKKAPRGRLNQQQDRLPTAAKGVKAKARPLYKRKSTRVD